jgi:hypothetical protein
MHALLAVSLALTLIGSACTKGEPPAPPQSPRAVRVEGPVGDLLLAYESARAKLAGDGFEGAQPFAAAIGASSRLAAEHAVTAKATFEAIALASDRMVTAKDIGAMRLAFGDVSKGVIALLVADPELRTGRFLMLCPMAAGYQKWVQTTEKLANPYFGKSMLECGETLATWST